MSGGRPPAFASLPGMSLDLDTLLALELRLARAENGDPYRDILREDAVVVLPGFVMGREDCAAAIDASPGWDRVELEDERVVALSADSAALVYRFSGLRGTEGYVADMVSTYVETAEGPKLVTHQHTMHWDPELAEEIG